MILGGANVEQVKEYLADNGCIDIHADGYGILFEHPHGDEWHTAFIPWGYEVEINVDGYPEISKPRINCGLKHVPVLICDEYGQEVEKLFKTANVQICAECILEQYEEVET